MTIDRGTRLVDLTLGDLLAVLDERETCRQETARREETLPPLVYGLSGIQMLYRCSKSTASRILRGGRIDAAVSQVGRKIVVNTRKALECLPQD